MVEVSLFIPLVIVAIVQMVKMAAPGVAGLGNDPDCICSQHLSSRFPRIARATSNHHCAGHRVRPDISRCHCDRLQSRRWCAGRHAKVAVRL